MDRNGLMKIITQASFACKEAIEYYNKAQAVREEAWNEYTSKFGPLTFYEVSNEDYWEWNKGPMPWEGGNC